jgi:hypothetical protein
MISCAGSGYLLEFDVHRVGYRRLHYHLDVKAASSHARRSGDRAGLAGDSSTGEFHFVLFSAGLRRAVHLTPANG